MGLIGRALIEDDSRNKNVGPVVTLCTLWTGWGTLGPDKLCGSLPSPSPTVPAWLRSALRPEASAGTCHHVLVQGDRAPRIHPDI